MNQKASIYNHITDLASKGKKSLAILIDPDKVSLQTIPDFIDKVNNSIANHIFVGGSSVAEKTTEILVKKIKSQTKLPIVIFPGDVSQISTEADALLFLSLISGDNPEYLIGQQIRAVSKLRNSNLEIIPTGYVLIENGKSTSVEIVTATKPIPRCEIQRIVDTAKAAELMGMKLIYLETGSGALHPVPSEIINAVKQDLNIPLVVGGGIKNNQQLLDAYNAGADLVVIGTAFEQDEAFFEEIKTRFPLL